MHVFSMYLSVSMNMCTYVFESLNPGIAPNEGANVGGYDVHRDDVSLSFSILAL